MFAVKRDLGLAPLSHEHLGPGGRLATHTLRLTVVLIQRTRELVLDSGGAPDVWVRVRVRVWVWVRVRVGLGLGFG